MNKKIVFSVIMAVIFVGLAIGIWEAQFTWKHILMGLIVMIFISLNFVTQINEHKSPFWIFVIVFVLLLYLYFAIRKMNTLDVYLGSVAGLLIGPMLYYGWIKSHKPFSKKHYLKKQKKNK